MQKHPFIFLVAVIFIQLFYSCAKQQVFPVEYTITYNSNWSVYNFPTDYPGVGDAILGPFVAFSHKQTDSDVFTVKLLASMGLQEFAESGATTDLLSQIDLIRSSGQALDRQLGNQVIFPENNQIALGFDDNHTYCSILGRINPSPDWFIAATYVSLKNAGGWLDTLTVTTVAYNAGTDGGNTFYAQPVPLSPAQPVSVINTAPLANNGVVASLSTIGFKRVK